MPIDEMSRRRPEWSEASVWITLADGGRWAFPKPWTETRGTFRDGRPTGIYSRTTHGPMFDEALEELRQADDDAAIIVSVMTIGAFLLRKQYDLSDAELEDLFVFRFDTPEAIEASQMMVQEIAEVANGTGGDRSFRVGSGSH